MLTEAFLIYGQPEPPAALVPLRAGPLSMLYDPTSGFLRRIKLGKREVLRGIYAAVRDRNWGTTPGTIRESVREIEAGSFRIEFESEHHLGEIYFVWQGKLQGDADGTIRYEFDGVAKTNFLRNRIGFCVLHPIQECAGARARQTRNDGSSVACRFPELIEPQIFGRSSFHDLRAVAHEITNELWAELKFGGDTFEMEDQRNWTDASFKTYCTPLALPFPVEVRAGNQVQQAVTLRLEGKTTSVTRSEVEITSTPPEVLTLEIPNLPIARLPAIGLGVASHGVALNELELDALRQLRPSHLRADLRLEEDNWRSKLDQAETEAEQLGARLELAIHWPRQSEVDTYEVARALREHASRLVRILALREGEVATSPETIQRVRQLLRGINAPVGSGSDCNFCELNREQALDRLALKEADFLFWSVNPQVHAFDHLSIMETLEAQTATARSAQAFGGHRSLVVSPVTLKQRFNPVATAAAATPSPNDLPPEVDARQLSHFAAAWIVGSLAALAAGGVEHVTLFETTGWRGVMERLAQPSLPEKFPSQPGLVFPLHEALASLAEYPGAACVPISVPGKLSLLGLFAGTNLKQIVAANLNASPLGLRLRMPFGFEARLQFKAYQVMQVIPFGGPGSNAGTLRLG